MSAPALTPYHLNPFAREIWGEYDPIALAQIEPALFDDCYTPKIYKTPDITQELIPALGYVEHGLQIIGGTLIIGFIFPSDFIAQQVNIQIKDVGMDRKFWSDPIPWYLLSNGRPFQPNFLRSPYPIVPSSPGAGAGLLLIQLWNTTTEQLRVQLQIVALEPKL